MPRKKPTTALVLVKPKPAVEEEPVEVYARKVRKEFPEQLLIRQSSDQVTTYSKAALEDHYETACESSRKSKLASCWVWMETLKINYCAAVWIMDIMEYRGKVKPIIAENSGPRKFTA